LSYTTDDVSPCIWRKIQNRFPIVTLEPDLYFKDFSLNILTPLQICRVLGNLCYDFTEGCIEIEKQDCLIQRLAILAQSRASRLQVNHDFTRNVGYAETPKSFFWKFQEDPGQRLPVVLPGFLANLINCSTSAMKIIGKK